MNEYFRRPLDVIDALRSLVRLGLSVSLPEVRSNGEMFFRVDSRELSVIQILDLADKNKLDPTVIRRVICQQKAVAAGCGM